MVSLAPVRENARMKSLLTQSEQLDRVIGVNCLVKWDFETIVDDTIFDSCNNYEGTIYGATIMGGANDLQSLNFDGVDDFVDIGNFDIEFTDQFTITAWFKADAWTNGGYHDGRIIDKSFNHYDNGIYWMLSTISAYDETRLRFRLKTDGQTSVLIADSGDINLNKWHLAVVVYDGATLNLFLDGELVSSIAKSGTIDTSNDPVLLGNSSDLVRPWSGQIDNVRMYTEAASLSQIAQLYKDEKPKYKLAGF